MTQAPVQSADAEVIEEGGAPKGEGGGGEGGPTLRARTVRASVWTAGGYGFSLVMRFVSTILVTRLLAPELLGIMLVAQALLEGLALFSEIGIGQSLIQNARGEERDFYNTAWTAQVIRGVMVTAAAAASAWPLAALYDAPVLLGVIPAVGLVSLIMGFLSPAYYLMYRRISIGKVTVVDLSSALLGTATVIVLAWLTRSIWSLVIGNLVSVLWKVGWSHALIPGHRNRLRWEAESWRAIWHFGKWILLSSAMMFVSRKADAFMLPKLLGLAYAGVYGVALMLADVAAQLGTQITQSVLFPAYSRVAPEGAERLRDVYYRSRLRLDVLCVFTTGGVCATAPWIIRFLYDDRYLVGSVMLTALSVRAAMMAMLVPCESVLFAMGHSWYSFARNAARAVWVIGGLPVGWAVGTAYGGADGALYGVLVVMALTEVPVLLVLWPAAVRHRVFWLPGELRSFLLFGLGLLAGYVFLRVMPQLRLTDLFQAMGWRLTQNGTP